MKIDLWSDVVCPFCYTGERHLEQALKTFDYSDEVEIVLHSFELDPQAPLYDGGSLVDMIAKKYGTTPEQAQQSQEQIKAGLASVGLDFDYQNAKPTNTFNAHRLVHLAQQSGKDFELDNELKKAYLAQGEDVSDKKTLTDIATSMGLDKERVQEVLNSEEFAQDVRADEQEAHQLGITAVPFFIFDNKYAISGAQPVELFSEVLNKVWDESHPQMAQPEVLADGASCTGDSCSL